MRVKKKQLDEIADKEAQYFMFKQKKEELDAIREKYQRKRELLKREEQIEREIMRREGEIEKG